MRVLCISPNCSGNVNGKVFERVHGGMLSEELTDEEARRFANIPGYSIYRENCPSPGKPVPEPLPAMLQMAGMKTEISPAEIGLCPEEEAPKEEEDDGEEKGHGKKHRRK